MAGFVWCWHGEVLTGDERNVPVWVTDAIKSGELTYDPKWSLVIAKTGKKVKVGQSIVKNDDGLTVQGKVASK